MPVEIFMPRLTHDMAEGVLVQWYKREGDQVQKGEPLFAVETDKATVDVEAEASGYLQGPRFAPGDRVPVGQLMGWIVAAGETLPEHDVTPKAFAAIPSPQEGGRIVASPLAKRMAKEHGIDLRQIKGRGPHGRVTQADVLAYWRQQSIQAAPLEEVPFDVYPLSPLQQTTGQRMLASSQTVPQFTLEIDVDMSEACRWQAQCAEWSGVKISYTALIVKVVAQALRKHPRLNAAFIEQQLRVYREINIGIAMAVEQGLIVPVIRQADKMSVFQIQEALTQLRAKAQELKFASGELDTGTFTISNLGMYGIDAFRAIINAPQVAILAVGRIKERPIGVAGQIVLRPVMCLVLSVDHRALDGAQAAPFLVEVQRLLENPFLML